MQFFYRKVTQLMEMARKVGAREARINKVLITSIMQKSPPKQQ